MLAPKQTKKLSQIFLRSTAPCDHMVDLLRQLAHTHQITQPIKITEIGPGGGILTGQLLEAGFCVQAIEADARFVDYLNIKFSHALGTSLRVEHQNALGVEDFNCDFLCGNIPYHISSALIFKALEYFPKLKAVIFMVQKEFALRLCAPPGTRNYGSLSVYTQMRAQVHYEGDVPKALFSPQPKVDSAIVMLCPPTHPRSKEQCEAVERISRLVFTQKRKQLRNSLKPLLITANPECSPIHLERRPETLTLDEFVLLANWLL